MAMFLKLTYRNWSNLRVPSSTSWINMHHVETIDSYHGGSLLRMMPNNPYERCLLVEDKSPEELLEMMAATEPAWHAFAVNNILGALDRLGPGPSEPM